MNNEKVIVKNSKGLIVLVVILLITTIGLTSLMIYDKLNTNNESIKSVEIKKDDNTKDKKEEKINTKEETTKKYTINDLEGIYEFTTEKDTNGETRYVYLYLNKNGLFQYDDYVYADYGVIGNYYIDDDKIYLNYLFVHGSDAALNKTRGTKELKIVSKDEIIDNELNINELLDKKSNISLKRNLKLENKNISDTINLLDIYAEGQTR